ncbi:DUF2336 domain-containing protein [Bradyrhizobium sp. ARR65]|uniref:DUF2336 domain-containing protein n=1 Tax=Bradyrhizobium sp. ARR65 TaxID=1040989 RepID=UPI00046506C4|nr:DUF2336 domain-containing protein [Bradyrhizobium sp. ARR65]
MLAAASLIPGLDDIVRHGNPERRAEVARRIAELFFRDAARLRPSHVDLFDDILIDLVPYVETIMRAELSERFSLLGNAPRSLVGQFARENEILVAGPVLRRSPVLDEEILLEVARLKGQGHLLAMAERHTLSADLTDVMVRRGDREVVRRTAGNAGAVFSENGFLELTKRAARDAVLTLTVGQRDDLPEQRLKELLAGSLDVIRRRLFDVVKPDRQIAIRQVLSEILGRPEQLEKATRDFVPAHRTILALHEAGQLNEAALLGFAKQYAYEESVAALAAMSGVSIPTLDRLISGDRHDPILIIGKTVGLQWATVRALILLRLGPNRIPAPADIEAARVNFARLMPSTADRVVSFWKMQQAV